MIHAASGPCKAWLSKGRRRNGKAGFATSLFAFQIALESFRVEQELSSVF